MTNAMTTELRKTGIDVVGNMRWGTHFCLFYDTKADLLETLVSYCKAGLESQEFCLWVVAPPVTVEDARQALKGAVLEFDQYIADSSIEIVSAQDWYLHEGSFDLKRVIAGWNQKLMRASAKGYAGVRVTGDTAWLEKKDWKDFCEYEESLNGAIANQRLAVLCTYPLAGCGAAEILDVVRTHQFAVTKRRGNWDVIETAGHKQAKAEIKRLNEELELRVMERTRQLTAVNEELTKEVLERQRAEEALRRSEAYLAEAQRLSHTGSWAWEPATGEIRYMSEECCRVLGFDAHGEPPRYEIFFQSMHADDRDRVKEAVETARREKTEFEIDHRIIHPGGEIRDIHVVGHPVLSPSGDLMEFVGTVIDITERKRAEESLRRSEGYLAEAQRLSHTGSWASKPDAGEILYFSEECYRVLGLDPLGGQLTYEQFYHGVHPDDQPRLREAVERSGRENANFETDYRFVRPGGEIRDIHVIGHPIPGPPGDPIEFVGTIMDVTESRRADVALRRSEAYLAEAQRLTHTGSWAYNIGSKELIHSSEEHSRLFGFDRERGVPSFEELIQRIHPEERAPSMQRFESQVRAQTDFDGHFRIVHPDGTTKYVYSTGHPVFNASGDVVEFVGTVMDVTDRKRAEEERERLRQAQADLAHVSRVNTMGELTASLAHEVNQPIAAAVTNANACVRWLAGDTPNLEKARAAAARIVNDGTHAAEIISRIRLLFKKSTAERELVNVNEVIREMIALLRGEATRYNVSVCTDLASDVPGVMGDRVQLQQVVMNLIMNSIDAMNDVDGAREIIIKSQRAEGDQLQVSISDTGVGLPPQADQIFNAFFTTKTHGTGMGLRICRCIIESHDGRLWAVDKSPRGASFYFTLPLKVETRE
jgi:PAS domain S-box-containing protein